MNKNRKWLARSAVISLLISAIITPAFFHKDAVKTKAATTIPVLVGDSIGWEPSASKKFTEYPGGSDIYVYTFTQPHAGYYKIYDYNTGAPMEDLQFDTTPSLSRDYIYRYENSTDPNFITIYPGEIKVQVFNPDNAWGSPAGARRMKVEYTSLLGATPSTPTGTSSYALRGPAVGDWTTHDINNCLVGISGYDGRYLSLTRAFNADDFKIFVYKQTLNEPYQRGFIDFDDHKSNASDVIMPGDPSSGYHESFHVNTAGNYMVVYDLKMQKIYFHNAGTTYHKVTKYYGELLIEEAAAFTGLNYTPAPFYQPEKKFVGWYEDALLETAYVPKDLTSDITLYAKFVDSPSVNLRFYDRNLDIKVDNGGFNEYVVFAYGKNTDGTEPLGGWPGRMMQKVETWIRIIHGHYAPNTQDKIDQKSYF